MVEPGSSSHSSWSSEEVDQWFEANYTACIAQVSRTLCRKFPDLLGHIEEIAQEALYRTLLAWHSGRFGADRDPLPYMQTTAHRLAVDAFRAKERPCEGSALLRLAELNEAANGAVEMPVDPLQDIVRPAIARMKPTRRRVVAQRQSQGRDEDTIAADLRIPRQQVRSFSSKAVGELREMDGVKAHVRARHLKKSRRGGEEPGE
ncbi:hypothetical protein ACFYNY_23495 [Streptomyces sp. NPDC006530]|uniref:hypothetical protein n=1 Tax=Streptomyces sp. NPDC006530 TaxID=3364750 RepID=UPI0036AB9D0D